MQTASGIALSGGYIYNALDGSNADAVENEGDTLDVCLSHPSPFGEFHYHFWGSCMIKGYGYWSDTDAPPLCRDKDSCTTATGTFTKSAAAPSKTVFYSGANYDEPIGLARDGHMIIGPYQQDGSAWGCGNHDICNGAFVDSQYVYVSTS